ncbi:MAG: hypothetical protein CVV56_09225 [Tenericutes bacterium HGW-Tenericutes-1]|jgi:hypothetical protein|nr:MAG: hypothetical protein CVV56_09225 [Tenericutes bacterium HGW-Tenericutes-1]PKM93083.1 MAG: hypothetical protein CVU84_17640 [Firmicutes bacterium HGW-Firmicutes-1]
MNDKFSKGILVGILICLIIIALKPNSTQTSSQNSTIDINVGEEIIQLAPNRIAVVDNRANSGMGGTILVFDYDDNTEKFNFVGHMNYSDYFSNPNKYGVPTN